MILSKIFKTLSFCFSSGWQKQLLHVLGYPILVMAKEGNYNFVERLIFFTRRKGITGSFGLWEQGFYTTYIVVQTAKNYLVQNASSMLQFMDVF
jgi:hypothetical protein